jgi:SpoVK/Ycf46/Vps4 family AAA+-type ATPase
MTSGPIDLPSIAQDLLAAAGLSLGEASGVVLFEGARRTGKTLAAHVLAHALRRDILRINLAQVISKYIGETEKNLDTLFERAERTDAILFFDEADALFGRRAEVEDAHDRYSNVDIAYLLQRIEVYQGVVIVATTLQEQDDANSADDWRRRLRRRVSFPRRRS